MAASRMPPRTKLANPSMVLSTMLPVNPSVTTTSAAPRSRSRLSAFPPNAHRNPPFHQLDVRVDKTWQVTREFKVSAYLDIYNVYNQGNVEGVSYNYNYTLSTNGTGIPFLPSLGLRGEL